MLYEVSNYTVNQIFPHDTSEDFDSMKDDGNGNDSMNDDGNEDDLDSVEDIDDNDSTEDEESDNELLNRDDEVEEVTECFVITSTVDTTLDLTPDNDNYEKRMIGTNAGDVDVNVNDGSNFSCVSGHVIFNQVGNCFSRWNKSDINVKNPQKFWVQHLCSTNPGKSTPLLQPEVILFPRYFFLSAERN